MQQNSANNALNVGIATFHLGQIDPKIINTAKHIWIIWTTSDSISTFLGTTNQPRSRSVAPSQTAKHGQGAKKLGQA
jgi:hypothetical protein